MFTAFTWVFAISVLASFAESYGIGANDLVSKTAHMHMIKALINNFCIPIHQWQIVDEDLLAHPLVLICRPMPLAPVLAPRLSHISKQFASLPYARFWVPFCWVLTQLLLSRMELPIPKLLPLSLRFSCTECWLS